MVPEEVQSVADFVESAETSPATLVVLNRTEPDPLLSLLERAFERQPVHVVERDVPGLVEDLVLLLDESGVAATSPLEAVAKSFLLINADRFRTGANDLEVGAVPAVLRELTDIEFDLRGYPASAKEKLLLILMSRYVEAHALRADEGALYTGFQWLSRLDDEYGTRQVYERLGRSQVETHVYGVDRPERPAPPGVEAHVGDGPEYRHSWFVIFDPGTSDGAMALVAWETDDNVWRGTWSFDADTATVAADYVKGAL